MLLCSFGRLGPAGAAPADSDHDGIYDAVEGTVDTDGDTYDVLANDGQTTLATVEYTGDEATANTYFVNGAAADLARFEEELTAIADGTRTVPVGADVEYEEVTDPRGKPEAANVRERGARA